MLNFYSNTHCFMYFHFKQLQNTHCYDVTDCNYAFSLGLTGHCTVSGQTPLTLKLKILIDIIIQALILLINGIYYQ